MTKTKFAFSIAVILILGIVFCLGLAEGRARADSGLSTQQVNSIIQLLQAFGVDQSTINQVYGELTTPTISEPTVVTAPVSSSETSTPTQSVLSVTVLPTCTLTAYAGLIKAGVYQTHVAWNFTQGASATLSSNGSQVAIEWPTSVITDSPGATFVTTLIKSDTDYEMDVTKGGVTGSCAAHVTIPTGN